MSQAKNETPLKTPRERSALLSSEPVKSPFGYHLIQVLERRTDEGSPERKRLAARRALRERKADEAYEDWIRQVRDRAYVEYKLEDR